VSAQHTPGPWKVRKSPHGRRYLCVQIGKDEAYTTLELEPADARLIAAAPDLLAALEAIFGSNGEGQLVITDGIADKARAAVAKAMGAAS
jgi:hypothetical protein